MKALKKISVDLSVFSYRFVRQTPDGFKYNASSTDIQQEYSALEKKRAITEFAHNNLDALLAEIKAPTGLGKTIEVKQGQSISECLSIMVKGNSFKQLDKTGKDDILRMINVWASAGKPVNNVYPGDKISITKDGNGYYLDIDHKNPSKPDKHWLLWETSLNNNLDQQNNRKNKPKEIITPSVKPTFSIPLVPIMQGEEIIVKNTSPKNSNTAHTWWYQVDESNAWIMLKSDENGDLNLNQIKYSGTYKIQLQSQTGSQPAEHSPWKQITILPKKVSQNEIAPSREKIEPTMTYAQETSDLNSNFKTETTGLLTIGSQITIKDITKLNPDNTLKSEKWIVGDKTYAGVNALTVTFGAPGDYPIQIIYKNSNDIEESITQTLTITANTETQPDPVTDKKTNPVLGGKDEIPGPDDHKKEETIPDGVEILKNIDSVESLKKIHDSIKDLSLRQLKMLANGSVPPNLKITKDSAVYIKSQHLDYIKTLYLWKNVELKNNSLSSTGYKEIFFSEAMIGWSTKIKDADQLKEGSQALNENGVSYVNFSFKEVETFRLVGKVDNPGFFRIESLPDKSFIKGADVNSVISYMKEVNNTQ